MTHKNEVRLGAWARALRFAIRKLKGAHELARQVKVLASKPEDPSLSRETHRTDGKREPAPASCPLTAMHMLW